MRLLLCRRSRPSSTSGSKNPILDPRWSQDGPIRNLYFKNPHYHFLEIDVFYRYNHTLLTNHSLNRPRDFLLNLINLEGAQVYPEDLDTSLSCFIDAEMENRLPLAHLPLSDMEKKLLSMLSINSDMGRRGHGGDRSNNRRGGGEHYHKEGGNPREHGGFPNRNQRQPREGIISLSFTMLFWRRRIIFFNISFSSF
jgi:hypothetical protein